jgi:hypothetical protein
MTLRCLLEVLIRQCWVRANNMGPGQAGMELWHREGKAWVQLVGGGCKRALYQSQMRLDPRRQPYVKSSVPGHYHGVLWYGARMMMMLTWAWSMCLYRL